MFCFHGGGKRWYLITFHSPRGQKISSPPREWKISSPLGEWKIASYHGGGHIFQWRCGIFSKSQGILFSVTENHFTSCNIWSTISPDPERLQEIWNHFQNPRDQTFPTVPHMSLKSQNYGHQIKNANRILFWEDISGSGRPTRNMKPFLESSWPDLSNGAPHVSEILKVRPPDHTIYPWNPPETRWQQSEFLLFLHFIHN